MHPARRAAGWSALALVLAARPAGPADPEPACAPAAVFSDDFSRFPPGWLSHPVGQPALNGAIQEYHYLPHRGVPPLRDG